MDEIYEINLSEFSKGTCKNEFENTLKQRWENLRGEDIVKVEEWSRFKGKFGVP